MVSTKDKPKVYVYKKETRDGAGAPVRPVATKDNSEEELLKYEPVIPQAPLDTTFHYIKEDGTYGIRPKQTLITSIDELKEFAEKAKGKLVGLDTETTGLSYYKDKIVGFSLALNSLEGYYVPIRHKVRKVVEVKENVVDENGDFVLTKTGKIRQHKVKNYTESEYPKNLPAKECLDILYDIMLNAKLSIWHNSEFDLNMLKAEGYDVTKCRTFDTLILAYIFDAEGKNIAGLKPLEKRLLGRYRPGFKETVGSDENFQYTDPEQSYTYACVDATSTLAIFQKLYPMTRSLVDRCANIISVDGEKYDIIKQDNKLIRAFVDYYGHAKLKIDSNEAKDYQKTVEEGVLKISEEIFSFFKRGPFSLSTQSKEFKSIMAETHIDTGGRTDKGAIAFGKNGLKEYKKNLDYLRNTVFPNLKYIVFKDSKLSKVEQQAKKFNLIAFELSKLLVLYGQDYCQIKDSVNFVQIKSKDGQKIDKYEFKEILKAMYIGEKKKYEVLDKVRIYSSYQKALNSYITKLTEVDECRMHYNVANTSSGRLSSGRSARSAKSENTYYINLNAQNLTKPKQVFYKATPSDEPDNILGYKFEYVSDDYAHENKDKELIVEAGLPKTNIRKCIVAPEGRYIASLDFCVSPETQVELQDGRVVPITYLDHNPQMIKTPEGYELAENFHFTGQRQKCVLKLKSGKSITCSPDHKFLVEKDGQRIWKALRDINLEDTIIED